MVARSLVNFAYAHQNVQPRPADTAVVGTKKQKQNHTLAMVALNVGISFQATAEKELLNTQEKALVMSVALRCAPKVVAFAKTRPQRLKCYLNVFIPNMVVAGILPLPKDL